MGCQYRKPAPLLDPSVVIKLDRHVERIYDERRFNHNGNEKFDR